jgi:hypothetical protein
MKITESRPITTCLITGEPVVKVLDFGQHAYADTFVAPDQLHLSEPVFPLQVWLNPNSGMLQLGYLSDAQDRYSLYNYSYTSSNSQTARATGTNMPTLCRLVWAQSNWPLRLAAMMVT